MHNPLQIHYGMFLWADKLSWDNGGHETGLTLPVECKSSRPPPLLALLRPWKEGSIYTDTRTLVCISFQTKATVFRIQKLIHRVTTKWHFIKKKKKAVKMMQNYIFSGHSPLGRKKSAFAHFMWHGLSLLRLLGILWPCFMNFTSRHVTW